MESGAPTRRGWGERKKVLALSLVAMAVVMAVGTGTTMFILYDAAFKKERAQLLEMVRSQARLMEAVARFDATHSERDHPEGAVAATLSQVSDAHGHYKGFGRTGEITLARREGDHIVFLLSHRHEDAFGTRDVHAPVSMSGEYAEPMQRALRGESGTMVGRDYRGATVLAAYEPVDVLDFGVVAKIDLAEIHAPFIRAGSIAGTIALLIIVAGGALCLRFSNPLIRRLEDSEARVRSIVATAADGIITVDEGGLVESYNAAAETIFGHTAEQVIGRPISMLMPDTGSDPHDGHIARYLRTGAASRVGTRCEIVGRHQDGTTVPLDMSLSEMRLADRRSFTAILRDVSERRAEEALRAIVEGTAGTAGEGFFRALVRHLASAFGFRYALVGELIGQERDRVRALAVWAGEDFAPTLEYELAGTPCENVVEKDLCCYPSGVQQRFPRDRELAELGAEAYLGTPLFDGCGRVVGVLAVLDDKPMERTPLCESILRIFASRAAMELERRRAEEKRERALERQQKVNMLHDALLAPGSLEDKLKRITDGIVETFAADFCRIWITRPGDRCETGCVHADVAEGPHVCRHRSRCLHLMASSGRYTHVDGEVHRRVPFGCYKIGRVAAGQSDRFLTNDVTHDPHIHDHTWAEAHGLVSFAGYKLSEAGGQPVGVLALFAKHQISREEDTLLEGLAHTAAQVIRTAGAETALQRSEARHRSLTDDVLDTSAVGIFILDADFKIVWMNRAMGELFGVQRDELIGADKRNLIRRRIKHLFEDPENFADRVFATYDDNTYIENFECQILPEGGPPGRWLEHWSQPIRSGLYAGGRIEQYYDITGRKRAEAERERLLAELEARNAELERFTYTVSHDLKSPLLTIKGFARLLAGDVAGTNAKRVKDDIARITDAIDTMQRLLDDTLELSRIGRVVHPPEEASLVDLAREAAEMVGGRIREAGARLDISPDLSMVYGDRVRIREVLQNLIDNAAKFTDDTPSPRIEIGARRDGDETVYFVRDNGAGIDPRYHRKIFGLFDQLDPRQEGTGVGLPLVRRIIEVHDGRIWVESRGVGHGSTFCFTLPGATDAEEQEEREDGRRASSDSAGGGRRRPCRTGHADPGRSPDREQNPPRG